MRKVAIIGSGAVGSTLGALLDQAREQVFLIARADHVNAIKRNQGLELSGVRGTVKSRIQAIEKLDFRPDLILLTVKIQDILPALQPIARLIEGIPVLAMQNGIRGDELAAEVIGRTHLLGAMTRITSTFLEPGKVSLIELGGLVIGAPFPGSQVDTRIFADMLGKVMPTFTTNDLSGARWSKLIFNLNNALPAITGREMQTFSENPGLFEVAVRMMREGLAVANAEGIGLEPIPGSPVAAMRMIAKLPVGIGSLILRLGFKRASSRLHGQPLYGSTLQSIRRGKTTEIDYLNGEIVRLGTVHGLPTPVNSRIVELVHSIEQTGDFMGPEQLIAATKEV